MGQGVALAVKGSCRKPSAALRHKVLLCSDWGAVPALLIPARNDKRDDERHHYSGIYPDAVTSYSSGYIGCKHLQIALGATYRKRLDGEIGERKLGRAGAMGSISVPGHTNTNSIRLPRVVLRRCLDESIRRPV